MRIGKLKIVLLVLCCLALGFEIWRLRVGSGTGQRSTSAAGPRHKPDFVLLPESEVAAHTVLFGNSKPQVESWEPTVADIDDLNSNLLQISALSDKDPDASRHIDHPDQFYRQYLAVVVNGKKTIVVNAMCSVEQGSNWRKQLTLVNDGGKCYWHAVFNPSTQTFSDLNFNRDFFFVSSP
jgi:hypothetical protein